MANQNIVYTHGNTTTTSISNAWDQCGCRRIFNSPVRARISSLSAYLTYTENGDKVNIGMYSGGKGTYSNATFMFSCTAYTFGGTSDGWLHLKPSITQYLNPYTEYWIVAEQNENLVRLHYVTDTAISGVYDDTHTFNTWGFSSLRTDLTRDWCLLVNYMVDNEKAYGTLDAGPGGGYSIADKIVTQSFKPTANCQLVSGRAKLYHGATAGLARFAIYEYVDSTHEGNLLAVSKSGTVTAGGYNWNYGFFHSSNMIYLTSGVTYFVAVQGGTGVNIVRYASANETPADSVAFSDSFPDSLSSTDYKGSIYITAIKGLTEPTGETYGWCSFKTMVGSATSWIWNSGQFNTNQAPRALSNTPSTWEWANISSSSTKFYPFGTSIGWKWVSGSCS